MAKDHKPDMGWIKGALTGEIKEKRTEAQQARDAGFKSDGDNLDRIADQWEKVRDGNTGEDDK